MSFGNEEDVELFECEDATDTRVGLSDGIEEIFVRKQRCERRF